MMSIVFFLAALWICWLFLDGLRTGEVWVKGGARDRFSRPLDMHSFAHKVSRDESPFVYWFNIFFYGAATGFIVWVIIGDMG